ncbi:MAG: GWxTD domain-containing protein [Bacteroidota bacterium]|nr:GWxTD domain-containing protein [Bacteroidota bacterium]
MSTPHVFGLVLGATMLLGCATASLQTPSQRRPYDREASTLHPELTLHRKLDKGEVDVYLNIPREELLYSRLDATAPFVAQLQVSVADTTWHLLDTAWADSPRLLDQRWTLEEAWGLQRLDLQVVDVLRNASWSTRRLLGPPDAWGPSDVLIWSAQKDWALAGQQATVGDTLTFHLPPTPPAEATLPLTWRLSNAPAPSQLPPPPFSSTRMRWDTLSPTPLGAMQADSLIVLGVPDGTTLLELDNTALALRIHGRPPAFPNVMEPMELMAPLRYIASRSEFQKLTQAQHPKQALDAFWLACTPSTENARSLLNTYYGRVEEANASFSGLVEGWRSDRGMVHIVFGVPQRIRRDTWNEYWIYGEEGTANALTFHFRKRRTLLDDNAYELQRSIQFRSVWDRGVSNWRNGRVRGD